VRHDLRLMRDTRPLVVRLTTLAAPRSDLVISAVT
jgi:hypothetical protein